MSRQKFFAQFNQVKGTIGVQDHHELIHNFTRGRTQSIKGLSEAELNELNDHLKRYLISVKQVEYDMSADNMRKKIISQFRTCGYEVNGRADMPRIYGAVAKYGYLHKPLNNYTANELPKLVSQFEAMSDKFIMSFADED